MQKSGSNSGLTGQNPPPQPTLPFIFFFYFFRQNTGPYMACGRAYSPCVNLAGKIKNKKNKKKTKKSPYVNLAGKIKK